MTNHKYSHPVRKAGDLTSWGKGVFARQGKRQFVEGSSRSWEELAARLDATLGGTERGGAAMGGCTWLYENLML